MNPLIPSTVGVVVNPDKPAARDRLGELLAVLAESPVTVLLEAAAARLLGRGGGYSIPDLGNRADLVIALGGDGTLLRVVRELGGAAPLVLGIHLGGLGFLTSVRGDQLRSQLPAILRGQYEISPRQTLSVTLSGPNRTPVTAVALNDVVVGRCDPSRVIRLAVAIDGAAFTEYICDGMIFATATGSTAYSLSAGGPILLPSMEALVLTPICPHALSNRSVIAGANSVIHCTVTAASSGLVLSVDGQEQAPIAVGDCVAVRRGPHQVRLVVPAGHSHFAVLREKLKWSGANV